MPSSSTSSGASTRTGIRSRDVACGTARTDRSSRRPSSPSRSTRTGSPISCATGPTLPVDPCAAHARTRAHIAGVAALARYPNAALKWGHAPELSNSAYPYPDLIEMLHELLDAFGAERVMWASDWIPDVMPHSWA